MKKPAKCVTPKRDHDTYKLNARDLKNLLSLITEANDILAYYINMPENKTGDLVTTRLEDINRLSEQIEDLQHTVDEVRWLCI